MRIVMVVIDGASDRPSDGTTPLEAAKTPFLDKLTSQGQLGQLYTVGQGVSPESDAGVFSLLGYDPLHTHLARGVVEALGTGARFNDGDLALRAGFATVEGDRLTDRRAGRNLSTEEAVQLGEELNSKLRLKDDTVKFDFYPTVGHRAVIVFHAPNDGRFSSNISNFDPAYVRKGNVSIAVPSSKNYPLPQCEPLDRKPESVKSAALVNEFGFKVREILDNQPVNQQRRREGRLPANFLLMRDAGTVRPKVPSFTEKWKLNPAMVADLPVELGIGKLLGMKVEQLPPGNSLEGYRERANRTVKLNRSYDFVYVHLKGPDEPGHDGLYELKVKRIEEIDRGFFSELANGTGSFTEDTVVCVTCDHSTPCKDKAHSDDPVPVLFVKQRERRARSAGSGRFTENNAKNGGLGSIPSGKMILDRLMSSNV